MTTFWLSMLAFPLPLIAFLMASRTRLRSLISLFRLQAVVLAFFAFGLAEMYNEPHLIVIAGLILFLKALLMPSLLYRIAKKTGIDERLSTYVRPTTLAFIAAVAIAIASFVAVRLPFEHTGIGFFIAIALSLALIGFELLITHKNLFGQGVGFLVLENGIFFLGLALVRGIPIFVEIGVLLDLLALLVLATALISRVHQMHQSVATDYLQALTDL
jgi:hydrogenase-4 component E